MNVFSVPTYKYHTTIAKVATVQPNLLVLNYEVMNYEIIEYYTNFQHEAKYTLGRCIK